MPDTQQPGKSPPPSAQCAKPARKSARCGVGDRSQGPDPRTHGKWVRGHGRMPQRQAVGRGSVRNPAPRRESFCLGALMPTLQRAKGARKRARCGIDDGSPHPQPPHPQPVAIRPRPHTPRMGRRVWGSAQSRTPPPRATSCRPHSAQCQLARGRAVGLVKGPQAHNPRN